MKFAAIGSFQKQSQFRAEEGNFRQGPCHGPDNAIESPVYVHFDLMCGLWNFDSDGFDTDTAPGLCEGPGRK